jgi:hypothetical protein
VSKKKESNQYLQKLILSALPPKDSNCEHCRVRKAMQQKYIAEMMDLYAEDVSASRIFFFTNRFPN